jgi:glutamyl/glutaminyl-tRNA synthetase
MQLIRTAITGKGAGPDLMTLIQLLDKEETLKRLRAFISANPLT